MSQQLKNLSNNIALQIFNCLMLALGILAILGGVPHAALCVLSYILGSAVGEAIHRQPCTLCAAPSKEEPQE